MGPGKHKTQDAPDQSRCDQYTARRSPVTHSGEASGEVVRRQDPRAPPPVPRSQPWPHRGGYLTSCALHSSFLIPRDGDDAVPALGLLRMRLRHFIPTMGTTPYLPQGYCACVRATSVT